MYTHTLYYIYNNIYNKKKSHSLEERVYSYLGTRSCGGRMRKSQLWSQT